MGLKSARPSTRSPLIPAKAGTQACLFVAAEPHPKAPAELCNPKNLGPGLRRDERRKMRITPCFVGFLVNKSPQIS